MDMDNEHGVLKRLSDRVRANMAAVGGVHDARADLARARLMIQNAIDGHDDADLPAAAALLDHALRAMCFHDPSEWRTAPDAAGRVLTTCHACNASWYEHE